MEIIIIFIVRIAKNDHTAQLAKHENTVVRVIEGVVMNEAKGFEGCAGSGTL